MSGTLTKPAESSPADVLANLINQSLQSISISCARSEGVRDLCHVGVIGYGAQVGSALAGALSEKLLIPISEVANNPAYVEEQVKKVNDGAGGFIEQAIKFPVWLDPVTYGGKPLGRALKLARDVLADWLRQHEPDMPPVVINITGTESGEDDWASAAEELKTLACKSHGNVLLINHVISTSGQPSIMYPGDEQSLPDEGAKEFFRASSLLPETVKDLLRWHEFDPPKGARAFGLNPASSLLKPFLSSFGSHPANFGGRGSVPYYVRLNHPACFLFLIDQSERMSLVSQAEESEAQPEAAPPKNNTPDWLREHLSFAITPKDSIVASLTGPPLSDPNAVTLTDNVAQPPIEPAAAQAASAALPVESEAPLKLDPDSLVETDDLNRLISALQAHDQNRRGAQAIEYDERQVEILRAVGLTLIVGPAELGGNLQSSPLREQVRAILQRVTIGEAPEARVCRLWLSCGAGETGVEAVEEFATLVKESLWEPVLALAFRALSHFGQRRLLADLLPTEQPLSLIQADAWLEAAHASDLDSQWHSRLTAAPHSLLSSALSKQWADLLAFETTLVWGGASLTAERQFAMPDEALNYQVPRTYEEAETQRLAARAAAAVTRSWLARKSGDSSVLLNPAGQLLPIWEREYLQALALWQHNNLYGAISGLEDALRHNPYQTAIRLALAVLLARQSPEKALSELEGAESTREIYVSQAALLARRGSYDEAESALSRCWTEPVARSEAARFSWQRGREQYRQREQALRTALAEQRGDWNTARRAWRIACADKTEQNQAQWLIENLRKILREVRELYMVRRELEAVGAGQTWLRSVLQQRLKRGLYAASKIPLTGDALFFRAAAMLDVFPKRAVRDFQSLLQQRHWIEAERSVGGARIVYAGDALLRFGRPEDALRAYELSSIVMPESLNERVAVATLFAEVMRGAQAEAIAQGAKRAGLLAPSSAWSQTLAALCFIIAGESEIALTHLNAARECGATESVCRYLQRMCAPQTETAPKSEVNLSVLEQPDEIETVARVLCGQEIEPERAGAIDKILGEGWINDCLLNPYLAASRLLAIWCDELKWDEALLCVREFAQSDVGWAIELAALVRVRRALDCASRGELEADQALKEVESLL
jgi:tetratricopeptide (TPR) repeat protein